MVEAIKLSVVIPAYNEAGEIRRHLEVLQSLVEPFYGCAWEVLVVDDGSTDGTALMVESLTSDFPVRLIRQMRNMGKGAAQKRGVAETRGELVLTCDADMSTGPDVLEIFTSKIEAGADIATGNRNSESSHILRAQPLRRLLAGAAYRCLARAVTGLQLNDFSCGFKLYPGDVARRLYRESSIQGWAIDIELLCLAQRDGLRVVEVPVTWQDSDKSSVRLLRDFVPTLRDMLKLWWRKRRNLE